MGKLEPTYLDHLEWLGFVQPTGLVVSAQALVTAGAILPRADREGQLKLRELLIELHGDRLGEVGFDPLVPDFESFARRVLDWSFHTKFYVGHGGATIPAELELPLPEAGEVLSPTWAVRERDPQPNQSAWQLVVVATPSAADLDAPGSGDLELSHHGRMERLLRHTNTPAGLLFNGRTLRLVSAPRGESSGWIDFHLADMHTTQGRPILAALRLLLGEPRLLKVPPSARLTSLLKDSRAYQNQVSERLAEQVLHALYELLRGFQAANHTAKGELLRDLVPNHADEAYRGLLTVLLRLVFLLFADERGMLPADQTFTQHYSLADLARRLRTDAALHPDTMDHRYGAWAQLLVLFRLVHDGAAAGSVRLPPRHGVLFDPDRFPFLEGRGRGLARQQGSRLEIPRVPDGTIHRVLEKLLVLDGERISYRALDVEQIGSVYETMMGFRLETATGPSVAIKAAKKHGAPTTIDLERLRAQPPGKRSRWLDENSGRKITAKVKTAVAAGTTIDDLHAALAPVVDRAASPDLVAGGSLVLQPSEERRRSGSHYTRRSLTEPIVRTTFEPILSRLREQNGNPDLPPRPDQILGLAVCDPAMGSGAFLVEACRQLAEALIEAWTAHGGRPPIPADEDERVFAMRLVAQRCLYGVDRNPVAVDLAKVSLWLATLAKEHPLTFVDHALRHGDSLVGLSRRQLEAFHWDPSAPTFQPGLEKMEVRDRLARVANLRRQIREAGEGTPDWELRDLWHDAESTLAEVRLLGDLVIAAFFSADKAKAREAKRAELAALVQAGRASEERAWVDELREAEPPLVPFHWSIELIEVFDRVNPGFDAIVGNPPFVKGGSLTSSLGPGYFDWLGETYAATGGQADLVAYFFRRAFELAAEAGTLGLVATKTIARGDTRKSGLEAIVAEGGTIFAVRRRLPWPGAAAVTVSVVWIYKGLWERDCTLDGTPCHRLTSFLLTKGPNEAPSALAANSGLAYEGYKYTGEGFLFSDSSDQHESLETMREIIVAEPTSASRIRPLLRGEAFLDDPSHRHDRWVIDFGDLSEGEARRFPLLFGIVGRKVRPARAKLKRKRTREVWWQFGEVRPGLRRRSVGRAKLIMRPKISAHHVFGFVPGDVMISAPHIALISESPAFLALLHSQVHEVWVASFGGFLEDRFCYNPSDCLENFAFPVDWEASTKLDRAGRDYCEGRATLMLSKNEGLTKTYNRFHDPDERDPEILELRRLHAAMDRAVLDAYGWHDIATECEFLLDYEDENDGSRRKKPWRYRWPDDVRDEVLARLLELNAVRAEEERLAGKATKKSSDDPTAPKRPAASQPKSESDSASTRNRPIEW